MKPVPFEYRRAASLEEALALRAEHGDESAVLAGGQSLVPALNLRLARPSVVIDVNRVEELAGIAVGDEIELRAVTRQRAAERSAALAARVPLVREALLQAAHPAVRSRGTVGGSVAHADPAAELPALMLALDARLVLQSAAGGERVVDAPDFFRGPFSTALRVGELLTAIRFPALPDGAGSAFLELSRRHGDFALVGAAAVLALRDGAVAELRVAVLGLGGGPVRVREVERAAVGGRAGEALFAEVSASIGRALEPQDDLHAGAAYRRRCASVLVRRALETAAARAAA